MPANELPSAENISPRQEEVRLSESCQELITKYWEELDMTNEADQMEYWGLFVKFFKHASKSREKYGIEKEVNILAETKANLETLGQKKVTARMSGREEEEMKYNNTILYNYNSVIINIIEEIKEKSLKVEGQKTDKKYAIWATPFLTQYYNIIESTGIINHIVISMASDVVYPDRLRRHLFDQQKELAAIKRKIQNLRGFDIPESIIKSINDISDEVQKTLLIYRNDPNAIIDPAVFDEISDNLERLQLKQKILTIYTDTLAMALSQ